jgi:hypothetical protein
MHLATDTTRPAHREAMEQLSGMIVSVAA